MFPKWGTLLHDYRAQDSLVPLLIANDKQRELTKVQHTTEIQKQNTLHDEKKN